MLALSPVDPNSKLWKAIWNVMATALQYQQVVFETDCLLLQQAIYQQDADLSCLGLLVSEFKDFLHQHPGFQVRHVHGQCNRVAHVLCKSCFGPSRKPKSVCCCSTFTRVVIPSDCDQLVQWNLYFK